MTQEEDTPIQTFVNLGLTYLQAKVYVTLVKIGQSGADVRKISQASSIVKQDVYRVLPNLQKIGIVEKIIATPTKYKPIPLEAGLSMLMQRKAEEYKEIQKKAKQLLEDFSLEHQADHEDISRFVITSERKLFLKKMREDIVEAQESIDFIYIKERMAIIAYYNIEEIKKAMERGVKIRVLTNREEKKPLDRNIQALVENSAFKIKFLQEDIPVGLVIIDKNETNIRIADKIVPSLWTNNRNVLRLSQIYFDCMWRQA